MARGGCSSRECVSLAAAILQTDYQTLEVVDGSIRDRETEKIG